MDWGTCSESSALRSDLTGHSYKKSHTIAGSSHSGAQRISRPLCHSYTLGCRHMWRQPWYENGVLGPGRNTGQVATSQSMVWAFEKQDFPSLPILIKVLTIFLHKNIDFPTKSYRFMD